MRLDDDLCGLGVSLRRHSGIYAIGQIALRSPKQLLSRFRDSLNIKVLFILQTFKIRPDDEVHGLIFKTH